MGKIHKKSTAISVSHLDVIKVRAYTSHIFKAAIQSLEQRLSDLGLPLTALQFSLLRLTSHHAQTISELSRKMSLDPSTLVPAVDALERKGFVVRGRDPTDRRRIPLSITDEGRILLEHTVIMTDDDPLLLSLNNMGRGEQQQLLELLRKLIEGLPEGEMILQHINSRIHLHMETLGEHQSNISDES